MNFDWRGNYFEAGGLKITIAGKTYAEEFLGIKDGDFVMIDRVYRRVIKSSDFGETWVVVDHPENYGFPSIYITKK